MPSLKTRLDRRFNAFAEFTADVIYDRRQSRGARILGRFLHALSYLFSTIAQTRVLLYEKRIMRNQPLGCLVVVVGNLTVGGTGKTPVVEVFARSLAERGRKVAILSRGYKSKKEPLLKKAWRNITHTEAPPPRVVSDGETVFLDSETAGDEPYMLARNLLRHGVLVLVDKNRVKAGNYAIRKFGVDTLVLDDGFQYLPLKGRLNLLLVDKTNPFGNGHLLPRGILREPVKHLRRASYVFLTKSDGRPDETLRALIRQHNPAAEIIECAHQPQFLAPLDLSERIPLDRLRRARVAAFSAIAVPEGFEAFLIRHGAEIRYNRRFLDHHRFTPDELEGVFQAAREAEVDFIVTTEKDAVRLPVDCDPGLPLYFLRLEIAILDGAEDFDEAVERICFPPQSRAGVSS
ncbi:MAG: tetraacyldisaccharide 4'-kinase [Opitutales bacterium]